MQIFHYFYYKKEKKSTKLILKLINVLIKIYIHQYPSPKIFLLSTDFLVNLAVYIDIRKKNKDFGRNVHKKMSTYVCILYLFIYNASSRSETVAWHVARQLGVGEVMGSILGPNHSVIAIDVKSWTYCFYVRCATYEQGECLGIMQAKLINMIFRQKSCN